MAERYPVPGLGGDIRPTLNRHIEMVESTLDRLRGKPGCNRFVADEHKYLMSTKAIWEHKQRE
jgi:hypothetical protein